MDRSKIVCLRALLILLLFSNRLVFSQTIASTEQVPVATRDADSQQEPFQVYCDFRCPFCARLFVALYSGARFQKVAPSFIFHHYPFHHGSEKLARFYEAAIRAAPSERDNLIESLYRFRKQGRPDNFEPFVDALSVLHGLDMQQVKRDMDARDVTLTLNTDEQVAETLHVDSTPTVYFQGTELSTLSPEELATFILNHSPALVAKQIAPGPDECQSCQRSPDPK